MRFSKVHGLVLGGIMTVFTLPCLAETHTEGSAENTTEKTGAVEDVKKAGKDAAEKVEEAGEKAAGTIEKAAEGSKEATENALRKTTEETQKAAFDLIDKNSVTVSFEAGSDVVSESEQTTMKAAVDSMKEGGKKIDRVIVAAWSDSDLPKSSDVKLSESEKKLADRRAENIEKVLKAAGVGNVDTYSMAEHANWFQRLFNTDAAQIKESMQGKEVDNAQDRMLSEKLAAKGGPRKAAVIVITEDSVLSH